eukprot:scaffold5437_cov180-Alexandrium_tamarense.AAC.8
MAEMDLAEALLLQPFAPLAGSIASNIDAKKADAQGRTILCTPAPPTSTTTLQQTLIAGIAFRIGRNATGDVVEAVRVSPPIMHGKKDGGEGNGDDEEEEGDSNNFEGGDMQIVGTFQLQLHNAQVMKVACSDDARLLLIACSDGTLICLNVLLTPSGENGSISVQLAPRWDLNVTTFDSGKSDDTKRRVHGLHYDVQYKPDGSVLSERRWSEDKTFPDKSDASADVLSDGSDDAINFSTLEFLHSGDKQHQFLAVAQVSPTMEIEATTTQVMWLDAASSSCTPPAVNFWPLNGVGIADGSDESLGTSHVTCATSCSFSECSDADSTMIAFGTSKGTLGILVASASGMKVKFLNLPLLEETEEDPTMPLWRVTHLNWFGPQSLAVGLTRVVIDLDIDVDVDDEDDPNEHQACFLIGSLSNANDPLDASSWVWSQLGDVVPFFSVPKGGRHVFHTAILPCMAPSSSTKMVLVGCNVASDVAIISQQDDEWTMLDLMEGSSMACPTDDEDEFLFLMGLSVVMLPLRLTSETSDRWHPFPMLASTEGGLLGYVPCHRTLGELFFARRLSVGGGEQENAREIWAGMGVPLSIMNPAIVSSTANKGGEKCILSRLVLGLDASQERFARTHADGNDDEDDSIADSDYSNDDLDSSSDELDAIREAGESSLQQEGAPPTFGSGISAPSFNFGGPSFSFQSTASTPAKTGTTNFSSLSGTPKGGFAFGSTGGATFGSPSQIGGLTATAPFPQEAEPTAPAPTFGSSAGFGSFASSTTQLSFSDLKSASNAKGFGSEVQLQQKKDVREAKPATFVSGTAVPSFGFGTTRGGFPESTTKSDTLIAQANPFGAFGKGSGVGSASMAPVMHKPLFGEASTAEVKVDGEANGVGPTMSDKIAPLLKTTCEGIGSGGFSFGGVTEAMPVKVASPNESSSGVTNKAESSILVSAFLKTTSGKRAMEVFNSVLADTDGSDSTLPSSQFATLVDEMGEGFHGDELEKQLALVDPKRSGQIDSNSFVEWYCNLVNNEDGDSSQESEVAEEKAKAEEAFDKLAGSSNTIPSSDFGKLIESMGTTYCEEEHRRSIKKISSSGAMEGERVITKEAFVD